MSTICVVKMKVHLSLWMKLFRLIFFFSTFIMGQHTSVKESKLWAVEESLKQYPSLWEFFYKDLPLAFPICPLNATFNSFLLSCINWNPQLTLLEATLYKFAFYTGFSWGQCLLSMYVTCELPGEPALIPESSYCAIPGNLFQNYLCLFLSLCSCFSFPSQGQRVGQERRENGVVQAPSEENSGYDTSPNYLSTDTPPYPSQKTRKLGLRH